MSRPGRLGRPQDPLSEATWRSTRRLPVWFLNLVAVKPLREMISSVLMFAVFGRFWVKAGPRTPLDGPSFGYPAPLVTDPQYWSMFDSIRGSFGGSFGQLLGQCWPVLGRVVGLVGPSPFCFKAVTRAAGHPGQARQMVQNSPKISPVDRSYNHFVANSWSKPKTRMENGCLTRPLSQALQKVWVFWFLTRARGSTGAFGRPP